MPEVTARRPALMTQLAVGFSILKLYHRVGQQPAALPGLSHIPLLLLPDYKADPLCLPVLSVLRVDSPRPMWTDS